MVETSFSEAFIEEQSGTFKPLSAMALVAFVCLLLGCIAPFVPVLLWFDFVAVALGVFAISTIRKKELSGEKLAIFTIVVGVFIIGMVPSMAVARRRALTADAVARGNTWFETIREKRFHDAHQLTLFYTERRAPNVPYDEHYTKPDEAWKIDLDSAEAIERMEGPGPYDALEMFYKTAPYQLLKADYATFTFKCRDVTRVRPMTAGTTRISIVYDVEFSTGPEVLVVTMQRDLMSETGGQTHWQMQEIKVSD